jgi:hypothetical protein
VIDKRFIDSGFTLIPAGSTPAEEERLRYPAVPPPKDRHGLNVPTHKKPQDLLKGEQ